MVSKSTSVPVTSASNDALTELEQLRVIVFGQAKLELEQKFQSLQASCRNDIDMLQTQINTRFSELTSKIEDQHQQVLSTIAAVDESQESHKQFFVEANTSLLSQLEMSENANKDDSNIIHKRIDEEVNKLDAHLSESIKAILAKLEHVTGELSNSKTDRKTLAQMLANMASDLDADS